MNDVFELEEESGEKRERRRGTKDSLFLVLQLRGAEERDDRLERLSRLHVNRSEVSASYLPWLREREGEKATCLCELSMNRRFVYSADPT